MPDRSRPDDDFLSTKNAEVVRGPEAVAEKVSDALDDAERFDLPQVKPPLSDALRRAELAAAQTGESPEAAGGQDALAGRTSVPDDAAGSAEKLAPDAEGQRP